MPISQLQKKNPKSSVKIIIPKNISNWNKRSKRRKRKRKKIFLKSFFSWIFILIFISFLFGSLILGGTILWFSKDLPNPDKLIERKIPLTTKIFDRTGEKVLYEIHGAEKRTFIPLKEMPPYTIQATIAIEDKNFYEHQGISLWGIFRGVVIEKLKGHSAQGGSTITQQLIKNAILNNKRTISRKIKEWILAWRMEKEFSKEDILQLYFNEIPYGSTAYGIEAASNLYFDKSAKDLTLAESVILAALPKAPTYYSPYGSHKDKLIGRQQYILKLMLEQNYIDQQQYEDALAEKLVFKKRKESIIAPHFVMYIKELLTARYGEKMIEQGGLQVKTTLDIYKQKKAEEAITKYTEKNEKKYKATNEALISIDAKTGQILAMVGSRDYFDMDNDGNVNVAIRLRQPGSSLKPLVYATLFTKGYTPDTLLYDVETNFGVQGSKEYIPHNYDNQFRGPVSIRQALAGSLNIPAVKALYLAGIDNVINYAEKMGYTSLSNRNRFGLSLVLGGGEVKLLEHVGAYGVFARDGKYNPVVGILEIKDSEGKIIESFQKKEIRVIDSESIRLLNSILSDNKARSYIFGENNPLTLEERPVAAKTGTTNDYKDAWTIGYTPSIVTGVWVGNNNGESMKRGAEGSTVAAPIWHNYMESVLGKAGEGSPIENFQPPKEIEKEKYINKEILIGKTNDKTIVKIDKFSQKLATDLTPPEAIKEKTFQQNHCILHYLNKNNPLGPVPEDPTQDPQYNAWETGINNWLKNQKNAEKNQTTRELPPTEFDDVHIPANKPSINILNVKKNQLINTEKFLIKVQTTTPRKISKVEYWANKNILYTATRPPYDLRWVIDVANGSYTLKAIVFDDVLNKAEDSVPIKINIIDTPLKVIWVTPYNNQNIYTTSFPISLSFVLSRITRIKKVDIFSQKINEEKSTLINSIIKPTSKNLRSLWNLPPDFGLYHIYTVITDIYNNKTTGLGINIKLN